METFLGSIIQSPGHISGTKPSRRRPKVGGSM